MNDSSEFREYINSIIFREEEEEREEEEQKEEKEGGFVQFVHDWIPTEYKKVSL